MKKKKKNTAFVKKKKHRACLSPMQTASPQCCPLPGRALSPALTDNSKGRCKPTQPQRGHLEAALLMSFTGNKRSVYGHRARVSPAPSIW